MECAQISKNTNQRKFTIHNDDNDNDDTDFVMLFTAIVSYKTYKNT